MTVQQAGIDPREELAERLFESTLHSLEVMSVYLGDALGLYRTLHEGGRATAPELAERAGIAERYAQEWLEGQAASGFLAVDDVEAAPLKRRYAISEGYAEALTDPDSVYFAAPLPQLAGLFGPMLPRLKQASRTGEGLAWPAYGREMASSQGDFNRPWIKAALGSEYLPAIVDLHERLTSKAARVADLGRGAGWAGIAIAHAYPQVTVDGYDVDAYSIELAAQHAADEGVSDRVAFCVHDVTEPPAEGHYDLAVVIETIHDLPRPAAFLDSVHRMLAPGGVAIVADEKVGETFTAPADELERLFYATSVRAACRAGSPSSRPRPPARDPTGHDAPLRHRGRLRTRGRSRRHRPRLLPLLPSRPLRRPDMRLTDEATLSHTSSRDGTEIAYWTSGEGPPLVLVHGVLSDHSRWGALRPHLEPSFTVHAMDRRGRGASGDAPDYAAEREFEDVAAVVDAAAEAAGSAVAVYGHSGGASFALGAAPLTSNVGRLVLYEPAVNTLDLLPPGLLERLNALLAAGDAETVVETFCRQVLHMTDEQIAAYRAQPSWPARVATAHTLPRELRIPRERLFDPKRTATIATPTLLVEGSETPDGFKAANEDVAAALPDAHVAVLDGQGHTADVLAPELVAGRLRTFLCDLH